MVKKICVNLRDLRAKQSLDFFIVPNPKRASVGPNKKTKHCRTWFSFCGDRGIILKMIPLGGAFKA
jgi:hypothetical protein